MSEHRNVPLERFLRFRATSADRAAIHALQQYRAREDVVQHGQQLFATTSDKPDAPLKLYRGLLDSLHDAFWPGSTIFEHRAAARYLKRNARAKSVKEGIREPTRLPKKLMKPVKGTKTRKAGRWSGVVRGSLVHKQLEDFANSGGILRNKAKAHAITRNVAALIKKRGWLPICGELGVRMPETNIATPIDMVCYDTLQHQFVFVELKTGYKDCFCASSRTMEGALRGLMANSPLNQALLQLMTGISFLLSSLSTQATIPWTGCVIRADEYTRDVYHVNRAIYRRIMPSVHADLKRSQASHYACLQQQRERRQALRRRRLQRKRSFTSAGLAKRSTRVR